MTMIDRGSRPVGRANFTDNLYHIFRSPRVRRFSPRLTCGVLLFTLAVACAGSPPRRPARFTPGDLTYLKQYMTWYIERQMLDSGLTGVSFALVRLPDGDALRSEDRAHSEIVWAGGFGYANLAARIAADEATMYQVASISKMVTATAVLQLVDRGTLDLDAPLAKALPDFRIRSRFNDAQPITLRTILAHHSGLPSDYLNGFYYASPYAPADLRERFARLPAVLRDEYVAAPPNKIFSYSNLGYSLAGAAVARAAGSHNTSATGNSAFDQFETYVQKNIFAPLDMRRSTFAPREWLPHDHLLRADKNFARGYNQHQPTSHPVLRDFAAGGLHTSAEDLAKFVAMLLRSGRGPGDLRILSERGHAEMLRVQNPDVPLDGSFRIGAGLFLDDDEFPGARAAGHGGDLPPFHGAVLFVPEHRLGAIVLTNSASSSAEMNRIAAEFVRQALETFTGSRPATRNRGGADPRPISPERRAQYAAWVGDYGTVFGVLRIFQESGATDRLFMELQGTRLELIPHTDGGFSVRYRLLGWIPIDVPGLRTMRIHFRADPETGLPLVGLHADRMPISLASRLQPVAARRPPDAWLARVGSYNLCNGEIDATPPELRLLRDVRLEFDDATNLLRLRMMTHLLTDEPMILHLRWLNRSHAVVYGYGRNQGETVRAEPSGILRYSGAQLCRAP